MKVNISEIPKAGLFLEQKSTGKDLDIERQDLKFNEPVKLTAEISREYNNVLIHLIAEARAEFSCARCLEQGIYNIKKEINIVKLITDEKIIDLNEIIREEIILDYPIKLLCKDNCRGICAGCGNNLNKKQCVCYDKKDFTRGIDIN